VDPAIILMAGAGILDEVLAPAGFRFEHTETGHPSGGTFAAGRFTRGGQYVEFSVRWSLGLVTYGWNGATVSHADYLRGPGATGAYPGYSTDPLDGFRHLAADLASPLRGFRDGDREEYDRARRAAQESLRRKLP
jgi:hypothetical protein